MKSAIRLYKPLTPAQLAALIESGWRRLSPDHPEQKYFYPKLHLQYAELIARMWNAPKYSAGYVAKFDVDARFIRRFEIQSIAYEEHEEYKIPIEELDHLNDHVLGFIDVVSGYSFNTRVVPLTHQVREIASFV